MRIALLASGSGGVYRGSSLQANTLAGALERLGAAITLVSAFTPLLADRRDLSEDRVAFGAARLLLGERLPWTRGAPARLADLLDRRPLLLWAWHRAPAPGTSAHGGLVRSLLRGSDGGHGREIRNLAARLARFRPQLLHVVGASLLGIGAELGERLRIPVVAGLTGDDELLADIPEPGVRSLNAELVRCAGRIDAVIAASSDHGEWIQRSLAVGVNRIRVIPAGIELDDLRPASAASDDPRTTKIGFLARLAPENGLDLLVEAFRLLRRREEGRATHLVLAGSTEPHRRDYPNALRERLRAWGLAPLVELPGPLDRRGKLAFLDRIDLLSVPTMRRGAKGLPALEAMACGVPVVEPDCGPFPELLGTTGGGLLVEPGSASALADGLATLLGDPTRRWRLGRAGVETVRRRFDAATMARGHLEVFQQAVRRYRTDARAG